MAMKSNITKRSIAIAGHQTSISLEHEFWNCVKQMAKARTMTPSDLVREIGAGRTGNLSSALRVYVLEHYQAEASRHRSKAAAAPQERAGA
jgi:predicted DNA-binding ribbon-helix-helix protein